MTTFSGSSDTRATDLTTFSVKIDGETLPETIGVVGIDIVREANRIPVARLVVQDGDAARQDFAVSGGDSFVPGRVIEIACGYAFDETLVFRGIITRQRISVRRRGGAHLQIEARDPAFRMTLDRRSRNFTDLSDADLLEEIIGGYDGLTPDVEATIGTYEELVQYRATDWDFIVTRAERNGMLCLLEDGVFRIAKPDPGQDPVKSVAYGTGIYDVDLDLDARSQVAAVAASAWDAADQAVVTSDVEDVEAPEQGNLDGHDLAEVSGVESLAQRHPGSLGQEALDAWAEAGMRRSRFAKIRGTVRFQGTGEIVPGDVIEIGGVGDRFNGRAFVSGVRHQIGDGDWQTTVQVGLDPKWHHERFDVTASPAAGLHPAAHGLQIGVVTQLQDDPSGEHRIHVRLPAIDPEDAGVWTRVATLDAGDGRGSFFLPEIDDEVVVGFIDGDPRQPVVLGMLNSSAKPAPLEASDDNHEKGFVTRSGMRVVFNDETPSLSIETPGGNRVELDDGEGSIVISDDAGSSVTIDSSGIAVDSAKALVLKAQTDVTIEGVNVQIKANASLTAEGSASSTFKSSGSTEVKGAIVQIN